MHEGFEREQVEMNLSLISYTIFTSGNEYVFNVFNNPRFCVKSMDGRQFLSSSQGQSISSCPASFIATMDVVNFSERTTFYFHTTCS